MFCSNHDGLPEYRQAVMVLFPVIDQHTQLDLFLLRIAGFPPAEGAGVLRHKIGNGHMPSC